MTKYLLSVLVLAGCASAPGRRDLPTPVVPPTAWSGATTPGPVAQKWWCQLGAEALDSLIAEALAHNFDLQAAGARLQQARAQSRLAGASSWPQLAASASTSRRKQNFIGFPIPGGEDRVNSTTSDNFGVDLSASWEIDLWGRLRAGAQAAVADWQAVRADWRGARLSLAAQTARAYFAVVEAQRQVSLAEATADNYRISTELITSRYQRGLQSSLDVRLGRSSLALARATLQQRRQQLDRARRQLELLLGRYPGADLVLGADLPAIGAPVPSGLPAELIGRRPDLAASERRLAAADRRLAEARRALYPRISLTGSGGRSSDALADLLDGDFSVWNLVGNIGQPLLQGGRLRAGVDLAGAGVEQAVANYAQTALRAYSEVELSLAAEGFLDQQQRALEEAAAEAVAARQLAEDRYGKGLANLITLLESQRRAFDAESRLLGVRRQRLDARIDLHLALGGGFAPEAESAPPAVEDIQ